MNLANLLPIKRALLTHITSRPALRAKIGDQYKLREVRGIVMHWTANTGRGANAMANRNYFNMGSRPASAHYVVDDRTVVQCLPDNEVGFHVGAKRYLEAGKRLMGGSRLNPNYFTLGIEMCVNSDGNWDKTYRNSVALCAWLFVKHKLDDGAIYRHFDITGKDCPKMMLEPEPWGDFRNDVTAAVLDIHNRSIARGECNTMGANVRSAPGMKSEVRGQLYLGEEVIVLDRQGNWIQVEPNGWVYADLVTITSERMPA
jgi:N-acetylmuramoyl-L-alanine amidase CwlA